MKRQTFQAWWKKNEGQILGLTGEGAWVAFGQLVSLLGTLTLIKVLTNYLDPDQFGLLALGLTLTNLITQVFVGGLLNGMARYFPVAVERQELAQFLVSAAKVVLGASALAFLLSCVGIAIATSLDILVPIEFALYCIVFSILGAMNSAVIAIQNAARNRKLVALHTTVEAWLKVLFALVAFIYFGGSPLAAMVAYIVATIIVFASNLTFSISLFFNGSGWADDGRNTPQWGNQILKFSYPFAIWGIFGWLQQSSARWSLEIFYGTYEVGLYASLFQLGYAPVQVAIGVLTAFLQPILYAKAGDSLDQTRREAVKDIVGKLILVSSGITTLLVIAAYWTHELVFQILTAPPFYSTSYLLPLMVAAGGTFGAALVASTRLFALMSTKEAMPASIGSSLLGMAAIVCGTYFFQVPGAVCGMFIHSSSYFVFILLTKPKKI